MRVECKKDQARSNPAKDVFVHEGQKASVMKNDEEDFLQVLNYVKSHMFDPFVLKTELNLINISTVRIATRKISESLSNFMKSVREELFEFVERIQTPNPKPMKKRFFDLISQNNLSTFTDPFKKMELKINGKITKRYIYAEAVLQRA